MMNKRIYNLRKMEMKSISLCMAGVLFSCLCPDAGEKKRSGEDGLQYEEKNKERRAGK